jgi:acetyl-CoA acetyltransferase
MNLIALADRLHKTIEEIEEISLTELNEWIAFYQLRDESKK